MSKFTYFNNYYQAEDKCSSTYRLNQSNEINCWFLLKSKAGEGNEKLFVRIRKSINYKQSNYIVEFRNLCTYYLLSHGSTPATTPGNPREPQRNGIVLVLFFFPSGEGSCFVLETTLPDQGIPRSNVCSSCELISWEKLYGRKRSKQQNLRKQVARVIEISKR